MLTVFEPKIKDIDDGFYADAKASGVASPAHMANLDPAPEEHVDAAKEVFNRRYANKQHPANDEAVTEWARGRAALANQLTWYEQKAGKQVVTVQDFYHTDSAITALFPAWIESEIQATLISTGLVSWLTMGSVAADGAKVTALYDSTAASERSLKKIGEGAELPAVKLTLSDSTIYLNKFGRAIQTSYEALASQRIDALGAHFRRIVQQVAVDETDLALHTLIAGDGTTMGAAETNATDRDVANAGAIAYSDLINWCLDCDEPYAIDKAVCGDTDLALILNLAEFKDNSYSGVVSNMPKVGPKAIEFARWSGGVAGSSYVDRLVIGIDSRNALQKYTYGGMIEETDNIIRRQLREFTFSYYAGFRKWDAAATVPLDVNAVL